MIQVLTKRVVYSWGCKSVIALAATATTTQAWLAIRIVWVAA